LSTVSVTAGCIGGHSRPLIFWVAVVKNPLSPVEHKGGAGVKCELFELGLDQFIQSLM
jgi:hypothetical protein